MLTQHGCGAFVPTPATDDILIEKIKSERLAEELHLAEKVWPTKWPVPISVQNIVGAHCVTDIAADVPIVKDPAKTLILVGRTEK
jgi:hypothetical protein